MPDRIAHDHPTIETIACSIGRHGGTRRPEVRVEGDLPVETGSVVRLVLDGTEYRTRIERSANGHPVLRHAAVSPRLARNPGVGTNELTTWIEASEGSIGDRLLLDVVEPGFRYGLRFPGDDAIYDSGRPDDSLAAIAQDLDSGIRESQH